MLGKHGSCRAPSELSACKVCSVEKCISSVCELLLLNHCTPCAQVFLTVQHVAVASARIWRMWQGFAGNRKPEA